MRIAGGPSQRNVTLGVADGEHQIAHITLHLYDGQRAAASETIQIENNAITCPPHCDQQ